MKFSAPDSFHRAVARFKQRVPESWSEIREPLSPSPLSPGSSPKKVHYPVAKLTKKRLWFLYLFANCIKTEIEERTGWRRGQVDYGLKKWRLAWYTSDEYWRTMYLLETHAYSELFGINSRDCSVFVAYPEDLRREIQERVQDLLRRGEIDWKTIDAFSSPFDEEDRAALHAAHVAPGQPVATSAVSG